MKQTPEQIKAEIKQRFVKLVLVPHGEQKFPVGPASAKRLGYDAHEINTLPPSVSSICRPGTPSRADRHVANIELWLRL